MMGSEQSRKEFVSGKSTMVNGAELASDLQEKDKTKQAEKTTNKKTNRITLGENRPGVGERDAISARHLIIAPA